MTETSGSRGLASELETTIRLQGAALDRIRDAVVVTDLEGRIVSWNRAAERMFGWTAEGAIGKTIGILRDPDDLLCDERARRLHTQGHVSCELPCRRLDGTRVVVRASFSVVQDAAGLPLGMVCEMEDLSDERRMAAQLDHARRLEALALLAGGVAHDFNSMLFVIRANSEDLVEDAATPDELRERLHEIQDAAERATVLTSKLLAFGRAQSGRPSDLDLCAQIRGIDPLLRRMAGEHVELILELSDAPVFVRADATRLDQILTNLVTNARDAMPDGGKLRIVVDVVERVTDKGRDDWARLVVEDQGTGMDDATQRRIFEPFFTTKEAGRGTGLGLATVLAAVSHCQGTIEVESAPSRGTRFTLFFPRVEPTADAIRSSLVPTSSAKLGRGRTALVVDDDDLVRSVVRRMLEAQAFRVLEANGAEAALRVSRDHRDQGRAIDLFVCDVVMPGGNGHDLLRTLVEEHPAAHAVLMSAYTDDLELRRRATSGDVTFLPKPFDAGRLAAMIRKQFAEPL